MPETPTWHIPYPSDSDPADVPADMEELADALEGALNSVALLGVPIGSPIPWLVSGIPAGYREFDGTAIVPATHPLLYAIFGGTLPDLRGRMLFGQTTGYAVGSTGGTPQHTLDPTQMPVHAHTVGAHRHIVDWHKHGGGVHNHDPYDPNHSHIMGLSSIVRHEGSGAAFNLISGPVAGGGGNAAMATQGSVSLTHTHPSGETIGAEAPGTSYEAPGTTAAGGLGDPAVTQPVTHMNPYRAVRWITRAA